MDNSKYLYSSELSSFIKQLIYNEMPLYIQQFKGCEISATCQAAEAEMWRRLAIRDKEKCEEIERLHATCMELTRKCKNVQADNIKRFANRLKRYYDANEKYLGYSIAYNIDRVAEELIKGAGATDNKCVACGETIPEGRQVCPGCEGGDRDGKIKP